MRIVFSVPAVPVAQPRQKHRIAGKSGRQFVQNYTPTSSPVQDFKASVRKAASEAYKGPPLTGPIRMSVTFVMPRVKPSWINTKSRWWSDWKAGKRVPHAVSRNDRDNLLKSTQDALNQLLWADDGLIYDGPVSKWVAASNEQPHVEVEVEAG